MQQRSHPSPPCSVATVYQAVEGATGSRVVIKAYHKDKMQPKHLHKLDREIQAMVAMNGSFVAELYSTFSDRWEGKECLSAPSINARP